MRGDFDREASDKTMQFICNDKPKEPPKKEPV